MVLAGQVAAAIAAIVVEYEFIAAERIAPDPLVANGALAITTIAYAPVQAHYIAAFILVTCCVGDGTDTGYSDKRGKDNKAHVFHKRNLNS